MEKLKYTELKNKTNGAHKKFGVSTTAMHIGKLKVLNLEKPKVQKLMN